MHFLLSQVSNHYAPSFMPLVPLLNGKCYGDYECTIRIKCFADTILNRVFLIHESAETHQMRRIISSNPWADLSGQIYGHSLELAKQS